MSSSSQGLHSGTPFVTQGHRHLFAIKVTSEDLAVRMGTHLGGHHSVVSTISQARWGLERSYLAPCPPPGGSHSVCPHPMGLAQQL